MKPADDAGQHPWRVRMLFLHGAMLVAPPLLMILRDLFRVDVTGFCLVKWALGVDCPGCGITRSVMAILRGHIREAFTFHPAGPLVLLLVALMVGYLACVLLSRHARCAWQREVKAYDLIARLALGLLLAGWVGKLVIN